MRKCFFCLFILYSTIAFCQDKIYYLEGNLGKSPIFMTVQVYKSGSETNLTAVYFYKNSLKDIKLEAKLIDNNYTFYFKPGDIVTEKFYLKKSGNNFDGFWYDSKEKQLAVHLEPVNFDNYNSNLTIRFDDERLNLVKYKFLEFKKQKTTLYNNKEIIWYSEKHCDSEFFRLGNNFSEKNKTVINPVLEQIHIQNTLSQLNCSSSFEYSNGRGIENTTTLNFLNNNLLGFEIFRGWDCGGAHPDFGGSGYLIDLNNGKQYEIDDIIAFDKSVTGDKKNNFDAFSKYRNDYFAPKLVELITSIEHFKKPDNDDDCDYTNVEYWDFVSWSYTKKGITFTPYFPRVNRACEEPFLVPFEKLKKYKNPKFPYNLN
ncbi:hypothetical protein L1276_002169 [Flavobacterium sp. HSC-32F16]|uniref:hypothetical protein n=1 Tax=Flavobacterium sp. HSC-32F16 TaxID=2910964 RepID=UPI0020A434BD|nr:hypothetical protein [Flavobacterium sp. HSC-32F16]MCP2027025.1 hypothetical protein [Flavobacterium sp. HSC-32F16]